MNREASRRKRRHQRQRASESIESLYSELQAQYPRAFPQDAASLHPLEIGIYGQIKDAVGNRYNTRVIHWTLQRHTNRRAYLRALASGKARLNLEGTVVGEVSHDQRQAADVKLHAKRQFYQARARIKIPVSEGTGQAGAAMGTPQEGSDGESMYEDKIIQCRDCDEAFTFTAGEQEFFASKGFENEPTRCQPCRQRRKAGRSSDRTNFRERSARQMFSVICDDCGQETEVPFQPSSDRPVYCRECLARHRSS